MTLNREIAFQVFKYAVYVLLAMNVYWFFRVEYPATKLQFPDGLTMDQAIEAFASTIDTAAWVVLLLMFELETYVLDDEQFTRPVALTLHGLRFICYGFVFYAFYGYIGNVVFFSGAAPLAEVSNLCALASNDWHYSTQIDEYVEISAANCSALSQASTYFQFPDMQAVVDAKGLIDIQRLAWVDVINSAAWILVLVVLEIDIRLQEHNRLEGMAFYASNVFKVIVYSTLFLAAIYWGFKGDFVDFWDAFLWLVAFFFIELNVIEWRNEEHEKAAMLGQPNEA